MPVGSPKLREGLQTEDLIFQVWILSSPPSPFQGKEEPGRGACTHRFIKTRPAWRSQVEGLAFGWRSGLFSSQSGSRSRVVSLYPTLTVSEYPE